MSRVLMCLDTCTLTASREAPAREGVSLGPSHFLVTVMVTMRMPPMTPIGYPKA